jgi:hypothetical protein
MKVEELEVLQLQSAEETQKTITKLTETYGKQREDLARQEESAKATIELSRIQGERTRIDTNTDVTKAEKKQILLALLAKENDLIDKQLKTYELLVKDETKTDEARIEAAKQLVTLEQQKTDVLNKQRELQRDNFVGQMRTQLVQLQDEWSNLGANLATGVIGGIKTAVQGIGDAIMGVIDGTKTWGQVFAQVGRSIIATIIQIVVQWIVSMTLLRVLKAIFGAAGQNGGFGNRRLRGLLRLWPHRLRAMELRLPRAGSLSAPRCWRAPRWPGDCRRRRPFKEGGLVTGGQKQITVNEAGEEFVMKNAAVKKYGAAFFYKLNQGILDTYTLMNAAGGTLTRPLTSDSAEMSTVAAEGRAASGGRAGSGAIHVKPSDVHVVVVNTQEEFRRFMESKAGEEIHVRHSVNNKQRIGIPS